MDEKVNVVSPLRCLPWWRVEIVHGACVYVCVCVLKTSWILCPLLTVSISHFSRWKSHSWNFLQLHPLSLSSLSFSSFSRFTWAACVILLLTVCQIWLGCHFLILSVALRREYLQDESQKVDCMCVSLSVAIANAKCTAAPKDFSSKACFSLSRLALREFSCFFHLFHSSIQMGSSFSPIHLGYSKSPIYPVWPIIKNYSIAFSSLFLSLAIWVLGSVLLLVSLSPFLFLCVYLSQWEDTKNTIQYLVQLKENCSFFFLSLLSSSSSLSLLNRCNTAVQVLSPSTFCHQMWLHLIAKVSHGTFCLPLSIFFRLSVSFALSICPGEVIFASLGPFAFRLCTISPLSTSGLLTLRRASTLLPFTRDFYLEIFLNRSTVPSSASVCPFTLLLSYFSPFTCALSDQQILV